LKNNLLPDWRRPETAPLFFCPPMIQPSAELARGRNNCLFFIKILLHFRYITPTQQGLVEFNCF